LLTIVSANKNSFVQSIIQFVADEAVQKTESKKELEVEPQKKFKIVEDPDSNTPKNDAQSKQNIEPEMAQHTERANVPKESKNIRRVNLPFIQVLHLPKNQVSMLATC
jgi:hypothetical protein